MNLWESSRTSSGNPLRRLSRNTGVPPGYPVFARNAGAGELRAYADIPREKSPAQFPSELNKQLLYGYHACVSYMDRNVGVLLKALQETGAAENTNALAQAPRESPRGPQEEVAEATFRPFPRDGNTRSERVPPSFRPLCGDGTASRDLPGEEWPSPR